MVALVLPQLAGVVRAQQRLQIPAAEYEALRAVERDDVNALRKALGLGANVNYRYGIIASGWNEDGQTLLMLAAAKNRLQVMKLLLGEGADIDVQDAFGRTAISVAARVGIEATELLLALHPNLKLRTKEGLSAAEIAALRGQRASFEILRSAGAPYDMDLVYVSALGDTAGISDQISKGADLNKPNKSGLIPLSAASRVGQLQAVQILLAAGAKPDGDSGSIPLIFAAGFNQANIVAELIAGGANPNIVGANGMSPLVNAIQGGYSQVVESLLTKGANAKSVDPRYSPIHEAVKIDNAEILAMLLAHGADINATQEGWTPLMIAASENKPRATSFLLRNKAQVGLKTKVLVPNSYVGINGETQKVEREVTALQMAHLNGHRSIIEIFDDPEKVVLEPAPDFTKSKAVTVEQWKTKYAEFDPKRGIATTVARFKKIFGEPTQVAEVGDDTVWVYRCANGRVELHLTNPERTGGQLFITNFISVMGTAENAPAPRSDLPVITASTEDETKPVSPHDAIRQAQEAARAKMAEISARAEAVSKGGGGR